MSWTQVTPMNDGLPTGADNPLPVTISGSGASGGATSDNQVTIISQLDDILDVLNTDTNDKRLTVRLDEVSDTLFYVGKAEIDKTHQDRLQKTYTGNNRNLYLSLEEE